MCYPSSNITYCIACLLCIGVILLNKFNSIQFNSIQFNGVGGYLALYDNVKCHLLKVNKKLLSIMHACIICIIACVLAGACVSVPVRACVRACVRAHVRMHATIAQPWFYPGTPPQSKPQ